MTRNAAKPNPARTEKRNVLVTRSGSCGSRALPDRRQTFTR